MYTPYAPSFYDAHSAGVERSAPRVLSIVRDLCAPSSVIDIGCGEGGWLAAWIGLGVTDITGVDGAHIEPGRLRIGRAQFIASDLSALSNHTATRSLRARLAPGYDLAMCLEVAEHLPEGAARPLVELLCSLAPVVLFSAAIPGQGGEHHVNERLQSYWAEHFAASGYAPIDAIRPAIWNDRGVEWWYRQNTILYASEASIQEHPPLAEARRRTSDHALDVIHLAHYRRLMKALIEAGQLDITPHALDAVQQRSVRVGV